MVLGKKMRFWGVVFLSFIASAAMAQNVEVLDGYSEQSTSLNSIADLPNFNVGEEVVELIPIVVPTEESNAVDLENSISTTEATSSVITLPENDNVQVNSTEVFVFSQSKKLNAQGDAIEVDSETSSETELERRANVHNLIQRIKRNK